MVSYQVKLQFCSADMTNSLFATQFHGLKVHYFSTTQPIANISDFANGPHNGYSVV